MVTFILILATVEYVFRILSMIVGVFAVWYCLREISRINRWLKEDR